MKTGVIQDVTSINKIEEKQRRKKRDSQYSLSDPVPGVPG